MKTYIVRYLVISNRSVVGSGICDIASENLAPNHPQQYYAADQAMRASIRRYPAVPAGEIFVTSITEAV